MIEATENEKDLGLKLRMMRWLWSLGYDVRKNVGLQEIWYDTKTRYTDIDVLGFKIDQELLPQYVICDCKSGASEETRQRLFWLSGVMKFFGVQKAYFVRTKMMSSKYLDLAETLGISLVSEDQLTNIEKAYSIRDAAFGPFSSEHANAEQILNLLKKIPRAYDYVQNGYWEELPQKQIVSLVSCFKGMNDLPDLKPEESQFLQSYLLSALAFSILRFSQQALFISPSERSDFIKLALLGGKLEFEEKKVLMGSFYAFMTSEIEQRYHAKYPVSSTQFRDGLVPDFAKYLVDIVNRICEKPATYFGSYRILTLLAFDSVLSERETPEEFVKVGLPEINTSELLFATSDFVIFLERSNLIEKETSKILQERILKIGSNKKSVHQTTL